MSNTIAIKLNGTVEIDGIKADTLHMREPSVNDMLTARKSSKNPEDQELLLFANLCEVTPETIRALAWRDYIKVQKTFTALTDDGEGSSPLD